MSVFHGRRLQLVEPTGRRDDRAPLLRAAARLLWRRLCERREASDSAVIDSRYKPREAAPPGGAAAFPFKRVVAGMDRLDGGAEKLGYFLGLGDLFDLLVKALRNSLGGILQRCEDGLLQGEKSDLLGDLPYDLLGGIVPRVTWLFFYRVWGCVVFLASCERWACQGLGLGCSASASRRRPMATGSATIRGTPWRRSFSAFRRAWREDTEWRAENFFEGHAV